MLNRARIAGGIVMALASAGSLAYAVAGTPKTVAPAAGVSTPVRVQPTAAEWDKISLGRAVDLWLKGDLYGAATLLETIDLAPTSPFAGADRAAFLLAAIHLRTGNAGGFERVAAVAGDAKGSPYRRWIRYTDLLRARPRGTEPGAATGVPGGFPGVDVLAASLLLESDRPGDAVTLLERSAPRGALASVHLFLLALAHEATGVDASSEWKAIAERKPSGPLEAEIVGSAGIRFALARMSAGDTDGAARVLERVPENSRYVLRARHMRGVMAMEAGDTATAGRILSRLVDEHSEYEDSRDVKLAMGGVSMSRHHWHAALRYFESAEDSWEDEHRALARVTRPENLDDVWNAWSEDQRWREEIRLSPDILLGIVDGLAVASLDLRRTPPLEPKKDAERTLWPAGLSAPVRAPWDSTGALGRHAPTAAEWAALRALRSEQADARGRLARQDRLIAERRQEIARRIAYLGIGGAKADTSVVELSRAVVRLEAILASIDASLRQLNGVRDGVLAQVADRTRNMIVGLERDILFMQAIRHFHVDGPQRDRPERMPEGIPSSAQLLAREDSLAHESSEFLSRFAAHYPDVINRSFEDYWRPRLLVDVEGMLGDFRLELARARDIGANIDTTIAAFGKDPMLMAELARRMELAALADSLDSSERGMRRVIAHAVAMRGHEQLAAERESIDYHMADASYELAIAAVTDTATSENAAIVRPLRDSAIRYLGGFLERHPQSIARGEARFRLADLRLLAARDDFQVKMRDFLGEKPASEDLGNRALAPFVDYEPAIALYRAMLAEDPDFPHMDAVLFNLGMILSDDGRPDADEYLARLVHEFPDAPDAQEAWLRMGSDRFDRKEYGDCVSYFEHAAAGSDPSFTAIALYKLGWAEFARDRFEQSTDAFRRLMDHYAAHGDIARSMDLRDEAREYLVHSLARAGSAAAFQRYFDSLGPRDYESDILLSLGHLMRSVSLYEDAIACDELWLARYPGDARALEIAERMVETYQRSNKPDQARERASRPGGPVPPGQPVVRSQRRPGVCARGVRPSHRVPSAPTPPTTTAARVTTTARRTGGWRSAATSAICSTGRPRTIRRASTSSRVRPRFIWPPIRSRWHTSPPPQAAIPPHWPWKPPGRRWRSTDAWYRTTRTPARGWRTRQPIRWRPGSSHPGRAFVERFPADARCPDIVWRQGNVAYAHGWFADAASILEQFGDALPGRHARGARRTHGRRRPLPAIRLPRGRAFVPCTRSISLPGAARTPWSPP